MSEAVSLSSTPCSGNLAVKTGGTTADHNFTLESVNCMGCCATGPVVKIDDEYFGHMTNDKVEPMLNKYR